MSDPALTRKPPIHDLGKGADVPADGRIYREQDGNLSFGLRYTPDKVPFHRWRLSVIQEHDHRRGRK